MPRVPTYDVPQVEQRALPGVRQSSSVSPAMLGAGARQQAETGRALMQAGQAGMGIATAIQDRENADMLFRAETALKDDYLKYEAELRNRKGQQAWGATQDTDKWFADQAKKHSEGLTNDTQRRLFDTSLARMRQQALGSASAYEAGERRRSLEESAKASIVGTVNQAAALAGDGSLLAPTVGADGKPGPSPAAGLKRDIISRVQVMADLNGWSPERKAAEEGQHLTNLHKQVIQTMAVRNPTQAKEYYEANKNEINGVDRDGVERALKEGTLRETAQAFADDVRVRRLDLAQALAEARKKYSGDEEVAAVQEVKTRFAEQAAIMRQGQDQAADNAWRVLTAGGGRAQIPLGTWNTMSGQDQRQVLEYLDARARRAENPEGKDDITNLGVVERLIEQGDITDRAGLAKYEPFFTKSTLKTLGNKIDKRGVVPPADIRRVYEERLGERVNPAKMDDDERAQWMAFQNYILENVRETRRPEDLGTFADKWFMRGYGREDAAFRNDPDTYGEARVKGRADFVVRTPESMRQQTEAALTLLENNGIKVPQGARDLARDELYTRYAIDAQRWAGAHGVSTSPELTAAYAVLRQNNKPITAANLQYVIKQMTRPSAAEQIPR